MRGASSLPPTYCGASQLTRLASFQTDQMITRGRVIPPRLNEPE